MVTVSLQLLAEGKNDCTYCHSCGSVLNIWDTFKKKENADLVRLMIEN